MVWTMSGVLLNTETNCFGKSGWLTGQNRSPRPPANITANFLMPYPFQLELDTSFFDFGFDEYGVAVFIPGIPDVHTTP